MKNRLIKGARLAGMLFSGTAATASFVVFGTLLCDALSDGNLSLVLAYLVLTIGSVRSLLLTLMDVWTTKLLNTERREPMVITGSGARL